MQSRFKASLVADRRILLVAGFWCAVFCALLVYAGINPINVTAIMLNGLLYVAFAVIYIFFRNIPMFIRDRPESPIRALMSTEFSPAQRDRILGGSAALIVIVIFMATFSIAKKAIPLINDFAWDGRFIALDVQIHGTDPWRILQPVIGFPIITSALSFLYHGWLVLIYGGGLFFAFYNTDRHLRERYLISYFCCWAICGVLLAIAFSSAGPCFVSPLFGDETFQPLMSYLQSANQQYPVLTLPVQAELLNWQLYGESGLGRGITAMPSMHVSLAFLFFLAMRHISRAAAIFFGIFAIIIMIGSVHLAYHYAVDGYASILVTAVIWKLCGYWLGSPSGKQDIVGANNAWVVVDTAEP